MRINFKQEELIEGLVNDIIKKFPDVEFINITEGHEDPESLRINMSAPEDEDREIELRRFCSDKTIDILLDYGYHMLVMPRKKKYQRKENAADKEILLAA